MNEWSKRMLSKSKTMVQQRCPIIDSLFRDCCLHSCHYPLVVWPTIVSAYMYWPRRLRFFVCLSSVQLLLASVFSALPNSVTNLCRREGGFEPQPPKAEQICDRENIVLLQAAVTYAWCLYCWVTIGMLVVAAGIARELGRACDKVSAQRTADAKEKDYNLWAAKHTIRAVINAAGNKAMEVVPLDYDPDAEGDKPKKPGIAAALEGGAATGRDGKASKHSRDSDEPDCGLFFVSAEGRKKNEQWDLVNILIAPHSSYSSYSSPSSCSSPSSPSSHSSPASHSSPSSPSSPTRRVPAQHRPLSRRHGRRSFLQSMHRRHWGWQT
jgi:hypothetical protein